MVLANSYNMMFRYRVGKQSSHRRHVETHVMKRQYLGWCYPPPIHIDPLVIIDTKVTNAIPIVTIIVTKSTNTKIIIIIILWQTEN